MKFPFPSYTIGRKDFAIPVDLEEEFKMIKSHKDESKIWVSSSQFNLRQKIFGFDRRQEETLGLVALARHYLSGGTIENRPSFRFPYQNYVEDIFAELKKVLPR
ncbi:MAG: hypothetical protein V1711_02085 [bacterium]